MLTNVTTEYTELRREGTLIIINYKDFDLDLLCGKKNLQRYSIMGSHAAGWVAIQ